MPQLSIYLDEKTRKAVDRAARRARQSVSQWAKERLTRALEDEWPEDYFSVFGSLSEESLPRPSVDDSDDAPREAL